MAGHRHDFRLLGLWDACSRKHLANPCGGLVTIHKWHVTVHQDQRVDVRVARVKGILQLFDGLFSILGEVCQLNMVLHAENHLEP